jgi:glyoxylase-like metal-dependent hydrolase (beta-lactamase superfamily II)
MKIDERVYLVGSGKAGFQLSDSLDCNVYLLDGGRGEYALIDAGGGIDPQRIVANIERSGVAMTQIRRILLTHVHGDHAAGARFFHDTYGMEVICAREAKPWLEQGDQEKTSIAAAMRAGVYPHEYRYPACPVSRGVAENDAIRIGSVSLRVLETPGHARGHLSYVLEEDGVKSVFAGDALFAGGKIGLQLIWDCSIPEYAETVAKLHDLRADKLFPGHGPFLLAEAWRHVEHAHACFQRLELPPNL